MHFEIDTTKVYREEEGGPPHHVAKATETKGHGVTFRMNGKSLLTLVGTQARAFLGLCKTSQCRGFSEFAYYCDTGTGKTMKQRSVRDKKELFSLIEPLDTLKLTCGDEDLHYAVYLGQRLFVSKLGRRSGVYVQTLEQLLHVYPSDSFMLIHDTPECDQCLTRRGTMRKCTGCQVVQYCSKKCQRNAWKKNHRLECKTLGTKLSTEATRRREIREKADEEYATLTTEGKIRFMVKETIGQPRGFQSSEEADAVQVLTELIRTGEMKID